MSRPDVRVEDLLRPLAPQVLGALVRRHGHFDVCEDAVQEALIAASRQWPEEGVPDNPRGWLATVASRRLTDMLRSASSRRRREDADAARAVRHVEPSPEHDDTLNLLLLCCHPSLSAPSQLALTLRAVGGLTTAEVAKAFLVPEATMAQRISRAKATVKAAGARFSLPEGGELSDRLRVVLHVLYLMFNEGYTTSSGAALVRVDLTAEAIRLVRQVHALLPDDDEVTGLLALLLLTDARRDARTGTNGSLVPLDEQDRSRWSRPMIDEGLALINAALGGDGVLGPYQVQAAIAAVHDQAPSTAATDWNEIVRLYGALEQVAPNPMVTLNRAIAVAEVDGPAAALELIADVEADPRMAEHHRVLSVKAHLVERAGDTTAAKALYRDAAKRTTSTPEKRYLESRAARL